MWTIMIVYLLIYCIYGSIWGVVVNKVIENRGYRENWFWWGFFFGFFALIVAFTRPQNLRTADDGFATGKDYVFRGFGNTEKSDEIPGAWKCQNCGKVNAGYVGTCGCGCDKDGNMPERSAGQVQSSEPPMRYCTSCGKQSEAGSKFCRYCGAKIDQ